MRILPGLVTLVLMVACGGATSATPTLAPTPRAIDFLTQAIAWRDSGAIAMTCGAWNQATAAAQTSTAASMLTALRGFDNRAGDGPPTAQQVELLRAGVTDSCDAGTDCTDPDAFCDTDSVAEAALPAYVLAADALRP